MPTDRTPFTEWVILELLGHRRLAGHLTETTVAGASFLQLTVPGDPPVTQLYSPAAVYAITPVSEDVARQVAQAIRPEPVHRWELPPSPADTAGGEEVPW